MDVEFRVTSDRREGLLLALGQVVIACGFSLVRQRMVAATEGVVLTMLVRGHEDRLLQLEENLGTHPMVRSYESARDEAAHTTFAAAPPAPAPAPAVAPAAAPSPDTAPMQPADNPRIEALLPQLAREYPHVFLLVRALEHELAPEQREPAMRYIGHRVGAWVYKRDFALGGRLALADAVRHIALPAMRQLVKADVQGDVLLVANSPFCQRQPPGPCCHFFRGMLVGLLAETHGGEQLKVVEARCRNTGADACAFEFHA